MKVGTWADAAKREERSPAMAQALLDATPGGPRVSVPMRYVGPSPIRAEWREGELKRLIAAAPIRRVPVASLVAIQHTVQRSRVASYLRKPDLIPPGSHSNLHGGPIDLPIVMVLKGVRYLWDGHHRTTADVLRGGRTVRCRLVDLDAARE